MSNNHYILRSSSIFTGKDLNYIDGYIVVKDNRIVKVGTGSWLEHQCDDTVVLDLKDQVIMPGLIDTHCFFTGYALQHIGPNLSEIESQEDLVKMLQEYYSTSIKQSGNEGVFPILGHGLSTSLLKEIQTVVLERQYPGYPIVLFTTDNESCWMNEIAKESYGFDEYHTNSESVWKLMKPVLNNQAYIIPMLKRYTQLMSSRGVTSVKEMGFDDFYGFAPLLHDLSSYNQLGLRFNFMSQPVGDEMNIEFGKEMVKLSDHPFFTFSGYNQMTDGSISEDNGDLKEPYEKGYLCKQSIDYGQIEKDVLKADQAGFRFSLHTQGDGAVAKAIDIFSKCQKDSSGKLKHRHVLTDLELTDLEDLKRCSEIGILAEVYPQIMSLYESGQDKISLTKEKVGERIKYYWNRRGMLDAGMVISCATDLPLLVDDLGESIYHACYGKFNDGTELNPNNAITVEELLRAWTLGGAVNLSKEKLLGTLEEGKLADLIVLNCDTRKISASNAKEVKVVYTMVDGQVVYREK